MGFYCINEENNKKRILLSEYIAHCYRFWTNSSWQEILMRVRRCYDEKGSKTEASNIKKALATAPNPQLKPMNLAHLCQNEVFYINQNIYDMKVCRTRLAIINRELHNLKEKED